MSEEEGEKYILHFKATQLRKKTQTLSLSSPSFHTFAVIRLRDSAQADAIVLGSTEIIENNQNPEWTTPVVVPFRFEKLQEISVRVYLASDVTSKEEREEALIGQFKFPLPSLLYAIRGLRGALVHDSHGEQGQVLVRGESLYETREVFGGAFSLHLDAPLSGGFFSTRECFLTLSRLNEDESWTMVWRGSKSSLPSSSPSEEVSLGQTRLSLASLCNGDVRRPLRLQLWEFHSDGRHDILGHVTTNTHSITASSAVTLKLSDDKDKTKQLGHVIARDCRIESAATFSQYVQGGCEISLLVAIDFTYSNGNPKDPTSLHYLPSLATADFPPSKGPVSPVDRLNPYQEAIQAVGKILQQYDADNMYPVFGFGAQTLGRDGKFGMTSHCFNLHPEEKEVKGIEGVLALYEEAMTRLKFSSPTYFTEIIEEACVIANRTQCNQESQKYFILLILTDGVINDMESTIEAVIAASALPLSIIIIGIDRPGDTDNFDKMRVLDSDDKLLQHGDLTAHRDIVQFVPFSRFFSRGMQSLAEEVLEEIPDQLVGYMEEKRIVPNVPTTSDK